MKVGRRSKAFSEINTVPYIDVTLVLLLVFMITAPLIEQGVEVRLPKAEAKSISAITEEPVVITVDQKGKVYVNLADKPSAPMAVSEMLALVSAVNRVNPNLPILIRGDRLVAYGNVVRIMALLKKLNIEQVGLMTDAESAQQ